jgi:nicotinamide-nucleotide adenylyltransferase
VADLPSSDARAAIERAVAAVVASPAPAARGVAGPLSGARSLAVLPGAFNPPTSAHLELARAAVLAGFEVVAFSIATRTIDKEEAAGLTLEERLEVLGELVARERRLAVIVQNRGLYADQAEAVRGAFPDLADLAFVVGMDKVPQIFDPRYYDDLPSALDALFARARLIVAARGRLDRDALEQIRADEPARRHAERIDWLELDSRWRGVSATQVRERLARGDVPQEWLPAEVSRFLAGRIARFTAGGR